MAGLDDLMGDSFSADAAGDSGGGFGATPNKDLMAQARSSLSGNWGMGILGYVLYTIIAMSFALFLFAAVFFVTVVGGINGANVETAGNLMHFFTQIILFSVSGALMVGFMGFFLGIAQDDEARLETLFIGFRRFWKSFGVYFFYTLFIMLWTLLFIIPGIIATFRYAMVFFIIADDEDCGPLEALGRSKEMMKGNKWKYFCLQWRFIWWALLVLFTFGIGYLWLVPYIQTAQAKFYEDVK